MGFLKDKSIIMDDLRKELRYSLGTEPELEANMSQNWEILSFLSTDEDLRNYWAVSTAACVPPVPFETFIPASAERVEDNLRVYGMETFVFDHHGDRPAGRLYGKTSYMELGCVDHFASIVQSMLKLSSYPKNISALLDEVDSVDNLRLVTFIYKPTYNGWIVIDTKRSKDGFQTTIHARANKSSRDLEVKDQETLYFDGNHGQQVRPTNGIRTHFRVVSDEVENNLGYPLGLEEVPLDRGKIKEVIGIV